jgi:hypothetical protein
MRRTSGTACAFLGAAAGAGPEGSMSTTGPESTVPAAASGRGAGRLRRPGAAAGEGRA